MGNSFFFYDLETSGLNAREHRIMQFAGIRTDEDLNIIGEPYNLLVKLNDDILPSPEALMVTGISPQETLADGYSEAEFAKILKEEIFTPNTTTIGFNNVRFDDEFIRHLFWRNFHDAYEWSWKDGRSRWDILDVVRMTRALRPEGIKWPLDKEGRPTNRLELLTKINGIDHLKAHDALSDVEALIAITKLIKAKQPQLYEYLFKMRDKKQVQSLVNLENKKPFVYTSGRYSSEHEKTTVAFPLTVGKNGSVIVYDLRRDPTEFFEMNEKQLSGSLFASWEEKQKENFKAIPVKELKYNQVPAVAPTGVLDNENGWEKINLSFDQIEKNKKTLLGRPDFAEKIRSVFEARPEFKKSSNPEAMLYDGFIEGKDKQLISKVQNASANALADFHPNFTDERLDDLLLHYKARNYPSSLSEGEVVSWEKWRSAQIHAQLPSFINSLQKLSSQNLSEDKSFMLEELKLWAENVMPQQE